MQRHTMQKNHQFLIGYILNNQPRSIEISARTETLATTQARIYLEALHAVTSSDVLSDIQVTCLSQKPLPDNLQTISQTQTPQQASREAPHRQKA